jgi:hypothetical protein
VAGLKAVTICGSMAKQIFQNVETSSLGSMMGRVCLAKAQSPTASTR